MKRNNPKLDNSRKKVSLNEEENPKFNLKLRRV